ncbi:prepilin-type N-terminal cleavage/methylation domain-containing protein [Acinetobacter sp. NIPH1876]|uniref:type IV pilin protein n=1 Tax=unclassified Acinetobacter TaxID=196816 RepID=UPI00148F4625|nr:MULTISPECIES: prepilin-type N-terminal cleavage/methylation domain-containing protein [unclassified Acinetobacter]MCJ0829125.1 prepilin-type N-terminal cleavage/methylation domain-containing protein [Acinetobacter sp. NIPH1876]NNP67084.1 pilus assembly protein PilA [Acinetobacter sp. Ac_5812]
MKNKGFTLIELLVVLVIIAIFAALVIPSYQQFARRGAASQAEHEIQRLVTLLEQHKARNLNYRGFAVASTTVPINTTGSQKKYTIFVRDATVPTVALDDISALGQGWVILAEANSSVNYGADCATCNALQDQNYSYLFISGGTRCRTKDKLLESKVLTSTNLKSANPCGVNSETW